MYRHSQAVSQTQDMEVAIFKQTMKLLKRSESRERQKQVRSIFFDAIEFIL